jgi:spore germination protein
LPRYGYDWILPDTPQTTAKAISSIDATQLAIRKQVPIQYSEQFQAPFFYYVDESGNRHAVWFEDPRSFSEKFKLIRQYRLRGAGGWQMSLGMPQDRLLMMKEYSNI